MLPGPLLPLHLFPPAALPQEHLIQLSSCVILYPAGAVPQPRWERCIRGDDYVPGGRQEGGEQQKGRRGDGQSAPRRNQRILDDGGVPGLPAR